MGEERLERAPKLDGVHGIERLEGRGALADEAPFAQVRREEQQRRQLGGRVHIELEGEQVGVRRRGGRLSPVRQAAGEPGELAADAAERLLLRPAIEAAASTAALRALKRAVACASDIGEDNELLTRGGAGNAQWLAGIQKTQGRHKGHCSEIAPVVMPKAKSKKGGKGKSRRELDDDDADEEEMRPMPKPKAKKGKK